MTNSVPNHVLVVALKEDGPRGLSLLVVRRKFPPFERHIALPGGFLRSGENPVQGALRELEKETGWTGIKAEELIALSDRSFPGRDPRGEVKSRVFLLLSNQYKEQVFKPGNSIESCGLVPLDELTPLAFDHGAILCEALGFGWPLLAPKSWGQKNWQPMLPLPREFSAKDVFNNLTGEEVVFFGCSFNPWHVGHRTCLDLCPNQNIVVILDTNPWKEKKAPGQQGCYFQSYLQITQTLKDTPYAVYPGFWGQETPNPTAGWLLKIPVSVHKGLLMGEDNFLSLPQWTSGQELIRGIESVYIAPREMQDGHKDDWEPVLQNVKIINPDLKVVRLADHPYKNFSSTLIREKKV